MLGQADLMNATSRPVATKTASGEAWLLPVALWASAAAIALLLAILAGRGDLGAQRAAMIASSLNLGSHQPLGPDQATPPFDAESATRQLVQAIRGLAEDRDRLTARLAALEHNVDDMTGSISRQAEAAKAAGAEPLAPLASPAPWPDAPATGAAIPWPPDAATSLVPLAGYGADIGTALSLKALQARWAALRSGHPQLFQGLQAGVAVRDNPRSNRAELRLVVGPFSDKEAAAQLCTALAALRLFCQPTTFDGRLALQ
jgi:hypothetical protein